MAAWLPLPVAGFALGSVGAGVVLSGLAAPLGPQSSLPTASIRPSGSLDQVWSCEPGAASCAEEFDPGREGAIRGNF